MGPWFESASGSQILKSPLFGGFFLWGAAFDLLRFRQDRHPVTPAEFSSVLVDMEGARDADYAQQGIGIEIFVVGSHGKAEKQEQNPHY